MIPPLAAAVLLLSMHTGCKEGAEVFAEKTVKAAKDTSKGLSEGIEKGRKNGESADGALIVSSAAELAGKGVVTVHAVRAGASATETEIDLAVENTGDRPLRLTKLDIQGLDKDGFAKHPNAANEVTVPASAKEKLTVVFQEPPGTIVKLRYWTVVVPVPAAKTP